MRRGSAPSSLRHWRRAPRPPDRNSSPAAVIVQPRFEKKKNHHLPSLHLCIVKAGPEAAGGGENRKHHEVRDRRGALLLRSRRPYKHDASGWWAPGDPWESGCMPPTALSPSSGGRIKEVSLTGLTSSHPLHQSWRGQRSDQLDPSAPQSATGA